MTTPFWEGGYDPRARRLGLPTVGSPPGLRPQTHSTTGEQGVRGTGPRQLPSAPERPPTTNAPFRRPGAPACPSTSSPRPVCRRRTSRRRRPGGRCRGVGHRDAPPWRVLGRPRASGDGVLSCRLSRNRRRERAGEVGEEVPFRKGHRSEARMTIIMYGRTGSKIK